jgi:hypothetical protein
MAMCEPFHDQLLPFVYGLLDEAEALALQTHLVDCPDCQQALMLARGQQTTLGRAALAVGPDEVPAFLPPTETAPPTLPFVATAGAVPAGSAVGSGVGAAPARRSLQRRFWAVAGGVAAAVLLALGAGWHVYGEGHEERQSAIAQQQQIIHEIDAQLASGEPAFKNQARDLDRKLRNEVPLHVHFMGPKRLQAGGEVVQVATQDLEGKPVDANVKVSIVDAKDKTVLSEQETVANGGVANIPLGEDVSLVGRSKVDILIEANTPGQAPARVHETVQVAAPSYVAHLITNKTLVRPDELLFFRALVLDRASLMPATAAIPLRFSVVDKAGHTVIAKVIPTGAGGIAAGELAVTEKWADGAYELRVAATEPGKTEVRPHARKLQVARDVLFDAQADRDLYKGGDIVNLNLGLQRMAPYFTQNQQNFGGPGAAGMPRGAMPNIELSVDGKSVPLLSSSPAAGTGGGFGGGGGGGGKSGANSSQALGGSGPGQAAPVAPGGPSTPPASQGGNGFGGFSGGFGGYGNARNSYTYTNNDRLNQMNLQFALPKELESNRVKVKVVLTDGKQRETFEQELAVVPSKLGIDLCPEGGDLVAGVPSRVYYRVRSPRGTPVNPEGRVIVLSGTDVLFDSAPGEGTGTFTFTPKAGDTYSVRITRPGGGFTEIADPFARVGNVRAGGLVLHVPQSVAGENEPLAVALRNPGAPRRVLVAAQCRGRLVGQQWVEATGEQTSVTLGNLPGARGLVRVTAYEPVGGALKPLAERLVYRTPSRRLELTALHLGGVITPKVGQRTVQMEWRASDEQGERVPAWVVAAVVDERVRSREPNPVAHFFIAGDVRGGEDLDNAALLTADAAEARQALDLFLGTAGWRHFEPVPGEDLTAVAPTNAAFFAIENGTVRSLQTDYEAKVEQALAPIRLAMLQQIADATRDRQTAQGRLEAAQAELRAYEARPLEYFRLGLGVTTLVLVGLACLTLAVGAWRLVRNRPATLLFAGSFACVGLCLIATLLLTSLTGNLGESPGPFAAGEQADRVPAWLGFAPRLSGSVAQGLPTGEFARVDQRPRMLAQAKAADRSLVAKETEEATLRDLQDAAKKFPVMQQLRSYALNSGQLAMKDSPAKKAVPQDLAKRFESAATEGHLATSPESEPKSPPPPGPPPKSPPKPLPAASTTAPKADKGGDDKKKVMNAAGIAREDLLAEQFARRSWVFNDGSGVEVDTLLWHPGLYLKSGSARVAFDVPATAGSYRVLLFGHTANGRVGFYEGYLDVQPELGR